MFISTKKKYRQQVRQHRLGDSLRRYHMLDDVFRKPASAHAYIRSCRSSKPRKIEQLRVEDKVYRGGAVCDGFYESMTMLKQCNIENLRADPIISTQLTNYDNIIQLCKNKPPIPPYLWTSPPRYCRV